MRAKTIKVPATTNNITKGIVNFLLERGHSASRVNVQGQWDEARQMWRKSGSRKGFYDIAAVIKTKYRGPHLDPIGMSLFVDTKSNRDVLSEEQLKFRKEVQEAGGCCFESKNYNDFVEWYNLFLTQHL